MSVEEIRRAQDLALNRLLSASGPLSTGELLGLLSQPSSISSSAIRQALWNLVDQGMAEYTSDRSLRPTGQAFLTQVTRIGP
jgi:hypothetical protein